MHGLAGSRGDAVIYHVATAALTERQGQAKMAYFELYLFVCCAMQVEKHQRLEAQQAAADAQQEAANKGGIINMLQAQLKAPHQVHLRKTQSVDGGPTASAVCWVQDCSCFLTKGWHDCVLCARIVPTGSEKEHWVSVA